MEMRAQVGRGEMHARVGGVRAGGHGGRVGRPHAGRRRRGGQQIRRLALRAGQHGGVGAGEAGEAEPTQAGHIRSLLRRQHGLGHAEISQCFHLGQALQGCRARAGHGVRVVGRSAVADRQACVMMGGADQAVEVDFDRAQSVTPGGSVAGNSRASLSREATG